MCSTRFSCYRMDSACRYCVGWITISTTYYCTEVLIGISFQCVETRWFKCVQDNCWTSLRASMFKIWRNSILGATKSGHPTCSFHDCCNLRLRKLTERMDRIFFAVHCGVLPPQPVSLRIWVMDQITQWHGMMVDIVRTITQDHQLKWWFRTQTSAPYKQCLRHACMRNVSAPAWYSLKRAVDQSRF